ncbi:hypothetical protein DH2020_015066 [Rehmannia glutinosa]|uniref:DUF7953 domain-containing protein n=1 Tax=Rehmannia glutinosa TaxID=99300 RepID=A0ABR0X0T1_REHGL
MICRRLGPRVPFVALLSCTILLSCSPVFISAAVVTLDSMKIFKTHEWLPSKPTVYFHCKGENKIILPDVKETNVLYTFKGEESWQSNEVQLNDFFLRFGDSEQLPEYFTSVLHGCGDKLAYRAAIACCVSCSYGVFKLPLTELRDVKCKRCGFYEKDAIKSDEFDEWEFCASDFTRSDGKYVHFREKEFNATFLCPDCVSLAHGASDHSAVVKIDSNEMHWAIIMLISVLASVVFIAGLVSAYKWWQKRKRQQQQARFLKLFEEADDIEDELGIGPLSHAI